jgi:hypothetical protein
MRYARLVNGDDFAVDQCTWRELLTSFGNVRELRREVIAAPRPQSYSRSVSASQTAVAVEFHLIKPVVAFG